MTAQQLKHAQRKPRSTGRTPRFSGTTKGIRLRNDQIEALEQEFLLDLELDWSKAVRRGIDLFLSERRGMRQQNAPVYPVLTGNKRPDRGASRTSRTH